jgi:hypothetical protein
MITGNQKVVVIDDKFDEVAPLLQALGKRGISYLWLDGSIKNFPEKPFAGVRLMFLDIELPETSGGTDKTKAAAIFVRIKKIIDKNAPPYFIVFWTKHNEIISIVLDNLRTENIEPVGHLNFEKLTVLTREDAVQNLLDKIDTEFQRLGAFNYLLDWENNIEQASSGFSNEFFSSVVSNGNQAEWSNQVVKLLGNLALSYTGEKSLNNNVDDLRNALLIMSDSFKSSIQSSLKSNPLNYDMPLSGESLDMKQLSKQNASLFIDFNPDKQVSFGNVFLIDPPEVHLKEALSKNIFPDGQIPDGTMISGMIVTPLCDMANKKYLHNSRNCFRVLYGLLIPIVDYGQVEKCLGPAWIESKKQDLISELQRKGCSQKSIDTANKYFQKLIPKNSLFRIEPFWYEQKELPYILIFHFGSLSSVWWDDSKIPQFSFAVKEHLAFDIQSKMSNHANRLGNSMLHPE